MRQCRGVSTDCSSARDGFRLRLSATEHRHFTPRPCRRRGPVGLEGPDHLRYRLRATARSPPITAGESGADAGKLRQSAIAPCGLKRWEPLATMRSICAGCGLACGRLLEEERQNWVQLSSSWLFGHLARPGQQPPAADDPQASSLDYDPGDPGAAAQPVSCAASAEHYASW